jgi:hypothetical protein
LVLAADETRRVAAKGVDFSYGRTNMQTGGANPGDFGRITIKIANELRPILFKGA